MSAQSPYAPPQHIVITDIHIPFWRLVGIFVKWALAAIPATIVLMIIFMLVAAVITALIAAFLPNLTIPRLGP